MTPLAIYVHIPFCTVKCGYCDFNAYAGMSVLGPAYRDAVLREIDAWAPVLDGRDVTSISFGGGTPGEFAPDGIAAIVAAIRERTRLTSGAEISLEANPGTIAAPGLAAFRSAGVTRLSLGAQSFNAGELAFLDRIHSPEATTTAVGVARAAGFESVSLDLIYGLPGQQIGMWRASLEAAIALGPDHLSCYALTVEEGTPLGRRVAAGEVPEPDPDVAAEMYDLARELLSAAGYEHYEISNWARPGHRSRHNLVYWTGEEYLGIGAGAHGYLGGERYENVAHPRAYIAAATSPPPDGRWPATVAASERPTRTVAMFDWIETHSRLIEGFEEQLFAATFGEPLDAVAGRTLAWAEEAGLVARQAGRFRLTGRGLLLQSEVLARVLLELRDTVGARDASAAAPSMCQQPVPRYGLRARV